MGLYYKIYDNEGATMQIIPHGEKFNLANLHYLLKSTDHASVKLFAFRPVFLTTSIFTTTMSVITSTENDFVTVLLYQAI